MRIDELTKYSINGEDYITISDFSNFVKKSRTAVNNLIRFGNKYRKLRVFRQNSMSFIPLSELKLFPFTEGNKRNRRYTYEKNGEKIFLD